MDTVTTCRAECVTVTCPSVHREQLYPFIFLSCTETLSLVVS
jgi:hypothetical protein